MISKRDRADALRWTSQGTERLIALVATMPDQRMDEPTALPGWSGKHLVAHIAANAGALINLTTWARTGEPTPMYTSAEQRAADIEAGSRRTAAELRTWVADSAAALDAALARLDPDQWLRPVRTAQGRAVPAEEIPWMRAREVMVHAVDLGVGVGFADLPADFLAALTAEIITKRSNAADGPALLLTATDHDGSWPVAGTGTPTPVTGTLAELTAYLAGRPTGEATRSAPSLPPWL